MENSKMIAVVENFMENSAPKEDLAIYRQYLDHPQDRLFLEKFGSSSLVAMAQMVVELEKELTIAEGKKVQGASYGKRSKLAEKIAKSCRRSELQGAYSLVVDGENCQCFTDGFRAFALKNPLLVPEIEHPESGLNLNHVFPSHWRDFPVTAYDIGKIGAEVKTHKATMKKGCRKIGCLVEFSGKFFDAEFFQDVVTVLGDEVTFYNNPDPKSGSCFESKNGIAILMPVNRDREKDTYSFSGERKI